VVFSTNKTDRHNITEILLKVALNTIILKQSQNLSKLSLLLQHHLIAKSATGQLRKDVEWRISEHDPQWPYQCGYKKKQPTKRI